MTQLCGTCDLPTKHIENINKPPIPCAIWQNKLQMVKNDEKYMDLDEKCQICVTFTVCGECTLDWCESYQMGVKNG